MKARDPKLGSSNKAVSEDCSNLVGSYEVSNTLKYDGK